MTRPTLLACTLILTLGLGACASVAPEGGKLLGLLTPYRMTVVQGNVVTKEQLERLRPGMSRLQVRDVLGTPLIEDLFHADRWDYPFTIRQQGVEPQRRLVVVRFKGDAMDSVEAPGLPSEREFVTSISTTNRKFDARVLVLTDAERAALPLPAQSAASAAETGAAVGPVRSYPPLEPGA